MQTSISVAVKVSYSSGGAGDLRQLAAHPAAGSGEDIEMQLLRPLAYELAGAPSGHSWSKIGGSVKLRGVIMMGIANHFVIPRTAP